MLQYLHELLISGGYIVGMPARGRGGDDILQQLRAIIQAREAERRGPRARRDPGSAKGQGRRAPQREAAQGDWKCDCCGAYPVWADRVRCFKCGSARDGGGTGKGNGKGKSTTGPSPTHRVPGTSVAAGGNLGKPLATVPMHANSWASVAARGRAHPGGGGPAAGAAQGNMQASVCGERPGGKGVASNSEPGGKGTPGSRTSAAGGAGVSCTFSSSSCVSPAPPTASSASSPSQQPVGDRCARGSGQPPGGAQRAAAADASRPLWADTVDDDEDGLDVDYVGELDGEGEEDTDKLREAYHGACAFLKRLRAKNLGASEEIIAVATRQRDDAERRWRASKPPPPTSLRLARASSSLDRAFRAKEEAEAELAAFESRVEAQRMQLREKIDSAKSRIVHHQARVDDLRAECGTISSHTPKPVMAACRAARVVGAGLAAKSIPMLEAALEAAESAGPISDEQRATFGEMHLVLRDLHSFEQVCRFGYHEEHDGAAEAFDIGDEEDDAYYAEDDCGMSGVSSGQGDGGTDPRAEPGREGAAGETGKGQQGGGSRWSKQQSGAWKKAQLGEASTVGGTSGDGLGAQPTPAGSSSSSGLPQATQGAPTAAATLPTAAPGAADAGRADADARESRGATHGELQALVRERQANGDWEATQALYAQQAAMAEEQRRLHRAQELADLARNNGLHLDPAARQWPLAALEHWAKENGVQ